MDENFIKYIEKRLYDWADWYSRDHCYGLGYPPYSMEYILMTKGIRSSSGKSSFLPCNEEAEEIEYLVKEMSQYSYNMALALRCHYFMNGGLRIKAKRINISHMQYKGYVDMAHQWLAGRLSASNKKSQHEKQYQKF